MIQFPPYLKKGDTIGLVCPAGYMDKPKTNASILALKSWGYQIKLGKTVGGNSTSYFSGTSIERVHDFQAMLDDIYIKAILCVRGGYGISNIIDQINFKNFCLHPKWIIGYSDITLLLNHIYSNFKISSIHGPMCAAFLEGKIQNSDVLTLKKVLLGKKIHYTTLTHEFNKLGSVSGELVGGNLTLLTHAIGTKSDINTKGRILFIEDIGEELYKIERMILQLKRAGKLKNIAGLIVGIFTNITDTTRPFGKTIYELINDVIKEYDYPVCYQFPVSHSPENYALKIGASYKLNINQSKIELKEI